MRSLRPYSPSPVLLCRSGTRRGPGRKVFVFVSCIWGKLTEGQKFKCCRPARARGAGRGWDRPLGDSCSGRARLSGRGAGRWRRPSPSRGPRALHPQVAGAPGTGGAQHGRQVWCPRVGAVSGALLPGRPLLLEVPGPCWIAVSDPAPTGPHADPGGLPRVQRGSLAGGSGSGSRGHAGGQVQDAEGREPESESLTAAPPLPIRDPPAAPREVGGAGQQPCPENRPPRPRTCAPTAPLS